MSPATQPEQPDQNTFLHGLLPASTLARLIITWGVVLAFMAFGNIWLAESIPLTAAIVCFLLLFATILYSAFGVVCEADYLAHELSEPYGTLILTISIVAIEVILIAAVMLGPGESATIARDSIFAVMMIILNLVTGICLLAGGLRYGEQEYNSQGAVAYLSMIVLLTGTALIVPNALTPGDGSFLPAQAGALALITTLLYAAFLALQTRSYRRFFVQPHRGTLVVSLLTTQELQQQGPQQQEAQLVKAVEQCTSEMDRRTLLTRAVILIALILPIVLLAHHMAVLIDMGVERAGAPLAVGGMIIAIIVFTPESITAVKAALANQMQRAINLCLGAFVSTIGLTVPAVLIVGLFTQQTVIMGLSLLDTVLLVITVLLSTLTFLGLRTSPLQGIMHLALFAIYVLLLFVP